MSFGVRGMRGSCTRSSYVVAPFMGAPDVESTLLLKKDSEVASVSTNRLESSTPPTQITHIA